MTYAWDDETVTYRHHAANVTPISAVRRVSCPHCPATVKARELDRHLAECPALSARRAHPSNWRPA